MNKLLLCAFLALSFVQIHSAYNTKHAHQLAYMSSIAYQSTAAIDAWSCSRCKTYPMRNVKSFSNSVGDLQGFTGFSSTLNGIVVSFRGSSNLQNWIINLSTNQIDYPKCSGCKVHNGFYTAWNNLAKSIVTTQVQNLRSLFRDAAIYVTGHSLGGAIAALSVPDLKQTFGNVAALITFGEPRVGNQAFSTYYNSVIAASRVVHYADIVPHIPPASFSFVHQSSQVWYDKAMKTHQICAPESNTCSNSLSPNFNTGDHSMDTYLTLPASYPEFLFREFAEYLELFKLRLAAKKQNLKTQEQ